MSGTVPVSRAVIDIGSNSVKCVVAQGFGANRHVIRELTYVTHLGEELVRSNSIGVRAPNAIWIAFCRSAPSAMTCR